MSDITIPERWLVEDPVRIGACVRLLMSGRKGTETDAQKVSGLSRHMWNKHCHDIIRMLGNERRIRREQEAAA